MSVRRPGRPGASVRRGSAARPTTSGASAAGGRATQTPRPRAGAAPFRATAKPRTSRNSSKPAAAPRPSPRVEKPVAGRSGTTIGGMIWPRILTVRAFVLFVVLLLVFVMVLPTVRGFMNQRGNLQELRQSVAEAQERQEELEFQVSRWKDDAFVASQARERLAYVYPGETAFRVLDPESVDESVNPTTGKRVEDGVIDVGQATEPWYNTIWDSIGVAGQAAPTHPEQNATKNAKGTKDVVGGKSKKLGE